MQRIKGKQGRFRGNLSGKRVNFSGRTVISPDPNVQIGQVVVPEDMAKIFTYPCVVNAINMEYMKRLIMNGPKKHPGANYVQYPDGTTMFINDKNKKLISNELKFGDIVERHLIDGDSVLFNRQPSLHRLSIMSHKAKVMPWKTLRFNECCCGPYNADFDGDEMNIHLPQTEEAKAEANILMNIVNNLLTPKSGEPLIAATQDFLTSMFLLTDKDLFFDKAEFCKICSYFSIEENEIITIPPPSILKPMQLWTGKQVVSMLIQQNNYSKMHVNIELEEQSYIKGYKIMCPNDGYVIFHNSELVCGKIGKPTLGGDSKYGLFYALIRNCSNEIATKCMLRLSKFSSRWLSNFGMSIGIDDVLPTKIVESKQKIMQEGYDKCDKLIEKFNSGKLTLKAGCNADESLESELNGVLSDIRKNAGDMLKNTASKNNSILVMATAKSKGSLLNFSQMVACVGQQTVSGQRIPEGFINRSLPHFEKFSKYPAARGFCANSFYNGLNATEFFFHTVGGREGLVDTAVKTAETGYMQRRMMKSLEDLSVRYDYSVRTSNGHMVQFLYGDDGLDPMFIDQNDCPVNFDRIINNILSETRESTKKSKEINLEPHEITSILESSISANRSIDKYITDKFCEDLRSYCKSHFTDKLIRIRNVLGYIDSPKKTSKYTGSKKYSKHASDMDNFIKALFTLTSSQFNTFLTRVWYQYKKAMITPGEAVGAVCAQSIGEPGTQMTLKTFHFAGVASMNITLGVPRIKEIINASQTISTPIIMAELYNKESEASARIIKGNIEKTMLGDITESIREVYTKSGCYIMIKVDLGAIKSLKLDLDIQMIADAIIKSSQVKAKEKHVHVISDNQIRIDPYEVSRDKMYTSMQVLKNKLPNVQVKGISKISRAVINQSEKDETYSLVVEGEDLNEVMLTPGIIPEKTICNHIIEVEKVLGIEAGRSAIIHEIQYTMKSHGIAVDPRHISMLADVMTFKGKILGITRFGIAKMKESPLMLASFEKTGDHLFDAAAYNKKDNLSGVSESIITGNILPVGTGIFKLLHSEEELGLYETNKNGEKHAKNIACDTSEISYFSDICT